MFYFCCDKRRRAAIAGSDWNGIDYLEVKDDPADAFEDRQRTLFVYFVNDLTALTLDADNVVIEGGERIRDIDVVGLAPGSDARVLEVEVDRAGDFSVYTLRLVKDKAGTGPPDHVDPMLAAIDFSFKVECPSEFDCQPERVCPTAPAVTPPIDYLAKDYQSFRQLMLDRMALLAPQWRERNAADIGVALVELLAYVGDQLSYQQDAVATEAYLDTARRRVSVRRHARLVDYAMHDGCNARVWVAIEVATADADGVLLPGPQADPHKPGTRLLTRIEETAGVLPPERLAGAIRAGAVVFETMHDLVLRVDHNELRFYTWSDEACCLPAGATRATLVGQHPHLQEGLVLMLEEVKGPHTGQAGDADPIHRHPVRLTKVVNTHDPVGSDPAPICQIEWATEDALPFALCIDTRAHEDVSVARGNIVLCDHGWTIEKEELGAVPDSKLDYAPEPAADRCDPPRPKAISPRYRPKLAEAPLTQAAGFDADAGAPARDAMHWDLQDVTPQIRLTGTLTEEEVTWEARRDLLNSSATDNHFIVEIDNDGAASIRFGDDIHGRRPEPETTFTAVYRVGNGAQGNVGAAAIAHVVTGQVGIGTARNPLPARGGVQPESMESARRRAPQAFRQQERAVTPEDYAEVTERLDGIQKAQATFRWTGSWHTVFLTVDRRAGLAVDAAFEAKVRQHVGRFRMAGHDLEVDGPRYVPLEIDMQVCVEPDRFRSEVKKELLDVFSNRILPDGRRGIFHPDNYTFGQTVYLSPLYAAAQAVPGVDSVHITTFQRKDQADPVPLMEGRVLLDRLEIARLDNDPNFAEHGVLRLDVGGGK